MDLRERGDGPVRRHPWELTRTDFFLEVLDEFVDLGDARLALDAGSGDGFFAQRLAARARSLQALVCWDQAYTRDSRARLGITEPRIELAARPPADRRFDLIVALDVLEHVEDDRRFLVSLREMLSPGGALLISVPAWPALATEHDRQMHHHRRYRPEDLEELIAATELEELAGGGLFHSLILPRALSAALGRWGLRRPRADASPLAWDHGALVSGPTLAALRADTWLSRAAARRGIALPGLSEWSLCRAP